MTQVITTVPKKGVLIATWPSLAENETGDAIGLIDWKERVVQVTGDFGNETVTIEGSMNGSTWFTLHNLQGNSLSFTDEGIEAVQENCWYIRPVVGTGGGAGAVDIKVILCGIEQ